jgi:ribonuclease HII
MILVDGTHKPDIQIDAKTIIGGDSIVDEISAASIIAKVYRDNLMIKFDNDYPNFYFAKHKGYGTKLHLEAIKKHGITSIHRKTFKGVLR